MLLKHAIDTINAIQTFSEKVSKATRSPVAGLVVILLAAALLATTVHRVEGQSSPATQAKVADAQASDSAQQKQLGSQKSAKDDASSDSENSSVNNSSSLDQAKRADPQSSASNSGSSATGATDSTTSFSTKITANGQVSAGTLIAYNAAKKNKTYYGGDLAVSAPSITLSKSSGDASSRTVTVSTPDGVAVGVPSVPSDDPSPYFGISLDPADNKATGASFKMLVGLSTDVPTGTYQLHLASFRSAEAVDAWAYHVFITINVID